MIFPPLENEHVILKRLSSDDVTGLYQVAADPEIWVQHPNKDRYLPQGFEAYIAKLHSCDAAYLIVDPKSGKIVGATSYYLYNPEEKKVAIGYTFLATAYWGTGFNGKVKALMLQHAFEHVDKVIFHVQENNIRSKKALEKIGAVITRYFTALNQGGAPEQKIEFTVNRADYQAYVNKQY